ncbi:zinc finger MYND domain-containing protein 11-like isoform X2 [Contarinia nasturtii]|nr:zinc finger MYND domain-containing protein 11-like isoform X2 [Contarinia nasturtii]
MSNIKIWRCEDCTSKDTPEELKRIPIIIKGRLNSNFDETFFGHQNLLNSTKESLFNSTMIPLVQNIKIKANSYQNFNDLIADFEFVVHKCETLLSDKHNKTKYAIKQLGFLKVEIDSVKKCIQCHIHANDIVTRPNWFTMVCDRPHIIVWAKQSKKYLPGKVMCANEQGVNVRFFGGTLEYRLNANVHKCLLYSKQSLNNTSTEQSSEYTKALKEVDEYIKNLISKFGAFNYAKPNTSFDPMLLDQYVYNMMNPTTTPEPELRPRGRKIHEIGKNYDEPSAKRYAYAKNRTYTPESDEANNNSVEDEENMAVESTSNENGGKQTETSIENDRMKMTENQHRMNMLLFQDFNQCFMKLNQDWREANETIESMKEQHKTELSQLIAEKEILAKQLRDMNGLYEQKINELVVKEEEYKKAIEEAKKTRFCLVCKSEAPDFYLCDAICAEKFRESAAH